MFVEWVFLLSLPSNEKTYLIFQKYNVSEGNIITYVSLIKDQPFLSDATNDTVKTHVNQRKRKVITPRQLDQFLLKTNFPHICYSTEKSLCRRVIYLSVVFMWIFGSRVCSMSIFKRIHKSLSNLLQQICLFPILSLVSKKQEGFPGRAPNPNKQTIRYFFKQTFVILEQLLIYKIISEIVESF